MPDRTRARRTAATRLTALAATVAAALVLAGCGLGAGPAAAPTKAVPTPIPRSHPVVTGFQPSWANPDLIDASAAGLDTVAISGIDIGEGGTSVTEPTSAVMKQLARAHAKGLKASVLLLNYEGGVGFSQRVAESMLSTDANRKAAAKSLGEQVKRLGWDGVMFDLEALHSSDAKGLTAFATALRAEVGPDIHLDAAIQPSTTAAGYRSLGYDIPGLLRSLDRVTLMAYDQHGTYNAEDAGPVGALDWQQRVLDGMLKVAPRDRIDLGVAGYGYRWFGAHGTGSLGDPQARRLVAEDGATATWDAEAGEWTATLSDGSVFWWADARSLVLRRELAAKNGLHGVAVWSLAASDPIPAG